MGCGVSGNFILFPNRFQELKSPTGTLDSGFNWERSRLSPFLVTTRQSQHPRRGDKGTRGRGDEGDEGTRGRGDKGTRGQGDWGI
ncbi:MAG: hypothetical protein F6J93_15035 [Oscillatoria sp. SIO1A7]|nr:hypothetical protein [Oscillatoria sp. SIO1A7]